MDIEARLKFIRKITVLSFLIGVICSYKLWLPLRHFPRIPIIPIPIHLIQLETHLTLLLIISLIGLLFKRIILLYYTAVIATLFLIIMDQNRIQPWVYMYLLTMVILSIYDKKNVAFTNIYSLHCLRLVIIGQYFWAGIHKINSNFIENAYASMLQHFFDIDELIVPSFLSSFGYILPFIEISFALLLIFPKYRFWGLLLATGMHCYILIYLIFPERYLNSIVYPWNIAMIAIDWLLFYKYKESFKFKSFKRIVTRKMQTLILLATWFLPVLLFFGYWDHHLSFSLYSGKKEKMIILLEKQVTTKLPKYLLPYIISKKNIDVLSINKWALGELNTPVNPELRIYKKIAGKFCTYNKYGKLTIKTYKKPISKNPTQHLICPKAVIDKK